MPVYEYECGLCRCRFDKRQRFDEDPAAICPECQGSARRVFHSTPIIFKGSGFYVTDSRKSGKKSSEKVTDKSKEKLPEKGLDKSTEKTPSKEKRGK